MRLLRHDWVLIRNAVADVFGSWRDGLLVGLVGLIGLGLVINAPHRASSISAWAPVWIPFFALVIGVTSARAAGRRLDQFTAHSVLCADALEPVSRWMFRIARLAPALLVSLAAAAAVDRPGSAGRSLLFVVVAAFIVGAVLPFVSRALALRVGRRQPRWRSDGATRSGPSHTNIHPATHPQARPVRWQLWSIVAVAQVRPAAGVQAAFVVPVAAALGVAALAVAFRASGGAPAGVGVLVVGTLVATIALSRIDTGLVRFAAFAGCGPEASAAAHLMPSSLFAFTLVIDTTMMSPHPCQAVLIISSVTGGVIALTTARVWYYRTRSAAAADAAIQLDATVAAGFGFAFAPLALGWLAMRGASLYRQARAATWAMP